MNKISREPDQTQNLSLKKRVLSFCFQILKLFWKIVKWPVLSLAFIQITGMLLSWIFDANLEPFSNYAEAAGVAKKVIEGKVKSQNEKFLTDLIKNSPVDCAQASFKQKVYGKVKEFVTPDVTGSDPFMKPSCIPREKIATFFGEDKQAVLRQFGNYNPLPSWVKQRLARMPKNVRWEALQDFTAKNFNSPHLKKVFEVWKKKNGNH